VLEVIDRGRGLVPGAVPGFGVRESIQARMAEVGGSATWRASAAGRTCGSPGPRNPGPADHAGAAAAASHVPARGRGRHRDQHLSGLAAPGRSSAARCRGRRPRRVPAPRHRPSST